MNSPLAAALAALTLSIFIAASALCESIACGAVATALIFAAFFGLYFGFGYGLEVLS